MDHYQQTRLRQLTVLATPPDLYIKDPNKAKSQKKWTVMVNEMKKKNVYHCTGCPRPCGLGPADFY